MPAPALHSLAPYRPLLAKLAQLARRRGADLWLAGGSLRDLLLGLDPPDADLAVLGDALALGRELAQETGLRFVLLAEAQAACRLAGPGLQLDLAGLRAPDLPGDLKARDFTINAMAWELGDFLAGRTAIIDPAGGRADLAAGVLRPAGPGVLADDPLRVLRAFRFEATHGLNLAPGLLERLAAAGPGLFRIARERIAHEWMLMMAGPEAPRAVRDMERAQALTRLIPALAMGRGVEQNPFHHLDVLEHNLVCLEELGRVAADPREYFGDLGLEPARCLESPADRAALMTAALLHDLGKPGTRRLKEPGWASFHRHDALGASLARRACRKLGLSRAQSQTVSDLAALHMRPFHLMGAQRRGRLTSRAVRRFLQSAGDYLPGLMALAMADTLAGKGPQRPDDAEERLADLYRQVAEMRDQALAAALAAPPLINGRDIMTALGMRPGPEVGRLLDLVREAQLDGEVRDRAEALAMAHGLAEDPARNID